MVNSPASIDFESMPYADFPDESTVYRDELFQYARNGLFGDLCFKKLACDNWLSIISTSLFAIACSEKALRKCSLCGKYFVPESRSDEMYCRFPNADFGNKPCKVAYKRIAQNEREQNDVQLQLNKKIYNRLRNRSKTELDLYMKRRAKVKPANRENKEANERYTQWLTDYEVKTRKGDNK